MRSGSSIIGLKMSPRKRGRQIALSPRLAAPDSAIDRRRLASYCERFAKTGVAREREVAMTVRRVAGLLIAVAAAIGCSAPADRGATTTEGDMIAVARLLATLDRIQAEADLQEFLPLLRDDAVFMPPDEPAVVGRQAIGEWYRNLYDAGQIDITHEPLEIDAFADVIICRGNARGTLTPKNGGEPIPFDNKFLMVLEKRPDGSLQIWRAMFNSNQQGDH
jgi:ketosteroid isomerase-like protein